MTDVVHTSRSHLPPDGVALTLLPARITRTVGTRIARLLARFDESLLPLDDDVEH